MGASIVKQTTNCCEYHLCCGTLSGQELRIDSRLVADEGCWVKRSIGGRLGNARSRALTVSRLVGRADALSTIEATVKVARVDWRLR